MDSHLSMIILKAGDTLVLATDSGFEKCDKRIKLFIGHKEFFWAQEKHILKK